MASDFDIIKAQLQRIEAKVSVPKSTATCYLCKKEKGLYTVMGYGSKYDGCAFCPSCLDALIDSQIQHFCKRCHRPLIQEQVITKDGNVCMECWNCGEK